MVTCGHPIINTTLSITKNEENNELLDYDIRTISVYTSAFNKYMESIYQLPTIDLKITEEFYSAFIPSFSLKYYLSFLLQKKLVRLENIQGVLLYTAVLLHRIKLLGMRLDGYTSYRLLLTILLLSSKSYEDEHYSNESWANVGGVSLIDLNKMEIKLLKLFNYNIFITYEQMLSILKFLY